MLQKSKDIEDLLIRKDMLVRSKNMDSKYLEKYNGIVMKTSAIVYDKHTAILYSVGYGPQDVTQITKMFTLYYFSLYSITNNPKYAERAMEKVTKRHGEGYAIPTEEWDKIEKSNLVNFLRQQLNRFVDLCYRRNENISVGVVETKYYVDTPEAIPASYSDIGRYGDELGYKRISEDKYNKLQKDDKGRVRDENGLEVMRVNAFPQFTADDYLSLFDNDATYLIDPEETLLTNENGIKQSRIQKNYDELSPPEKHKLLKRFILDNKGNPKLKDELTAARKLIKQVLL